MEPILFPPEPTPVENTGITVCDVQFRSGSKIYFFVPGKLIVKTGDTVILDTARGAEYGTCTRGNHVVTEREVVAPLRPVLRLATTQDKRTHEENLQREKHALAVCQRKIDELKLEMQLVSAEYAFDGSKILFFFTADGRVDFRELVKNLTSALRTRIELRQIGVRDKAKMVGGLGICGRPFCCREFLDDFQPVSIKMAKTQNLSLNPTKISGTCGRLMCCLNYEQEAYEELLRTSPKVDSFVDTPDGRGTVTSVNLLGQSVQVRLEKQPDTCVCHKNCEICVLRNGKAKKNDEPIPDGLAPISGNGPRKVEQPEPSFMTYLEPIVLRQTNESLVTEREELPEEPIFADDDMEPRNRSRRRRGGKNHRPKAENRAENRSETAVRPQKNERSPKAAKPKQEHHAADDTAPEQKERKPRSSHRKRRRFGPKPE